MILRTRWPLVAASFFGHVIIGEHYEHLTQIEKEAVMAHEEAHFLLGHTKTRIRWLFTRRWRDIPALCRLQEIEADRIAVSLGHGHGLVRLLSRAHNTPQSAFHPSHQRRIDYICKMMNIGSRDGK